jgi:putative oxidoreductase
MRYTPLLARLLLALIFVVSGGGKLVDPNHAIGMLADKAMPAPTVLAYLAGLTELGCGLALLFGCGARYAAMILFLFLIPTTYLFHNPVGLTGAAKQMQLIHLMKNLAIMGGLLMVVAHGAGAVSFDASKQHTIVT